MSARGPLLRRLGRDERGTTLVDFALVISLFLLIFFGLLDFGRLAYNLVGAEKAVQMAARIAAVRHPACAGLPVSHARGTGTGQQFGALCSAATDTCQAVTVACDGAAANVTAAEIWAAVRPLLPPTDADGTATGPANLRFTYATDVRLGFLGGPFVPVVTVELQNLDFRFLGPLGGLARVAGPTAPRPPATCPSA